MADKPISPQGYLIGMVPMSEHPFWGDDIPEGQGVPAGGTTGQVLAKKSDADYDTEWVDQTGGGGGVTMAPITTNPITVESQSGGSMNLKWDGYSKISDCLLIGKINFSGADFGGINITIGVADNFGVGTFRASSSVLTDSGDVTASFLNSFVQFSFMNKSLKEISGEISLSNLYLVPIGRA